ncbi:protein of unknown function [Shewanella benthica]|uniref:Uncharacterized protein n=1 Tax=Shewanella benthica TaxID=43661 RepID=A0A330M972_9GAMM|nr:hypothetical protein [Shewanella benthica]SQH77954.1 protein of unknown function [Shewanella benthica]
MANTFYAEMGFPVLLLVFIVDKRTRHDELNKINDGMTDASNET